MTTEQQTLITLWNEREARFAAKVTALKAIPAATRTYGDLRNAEGKLAELRECRSEFLKEFGLTSPPGK